VRRSNHLQRGLAKIPITVNQGFAIDWMRDPIFSVPFRLTRAAALESVHGRRPFPTNAGLSSIQPSSFTVHALISSGQMNWPSQLVDR
jgi:hypothetical protein